MGFTDYLRKHGVEDCAKRFGVSKHAVHSWIYTKKRPRPEKAVEIVRATGGDVTLAEIYAGDTQ